MNKVIIFLLLLMQSGMVHAQSSSFYHIKKDSSGFELTSAGASYLASLPLKCIMQEWPNKTNHTSNGAADHVMQPAQLHPAFYGCFDWHSSVHGHWMLVKLLKKFPGMPEAEKIRSALRSTLTGANLAKEAGYFSMPLTASWERTYGWAWLLKLDAELKTWDDADGRDWHAAMAPLTQKIAGLWKDFLPKQTYANRTGVHPNTAFGMVFGLEYAKVAGDTSLERSLKKAALLLFGKDKNIPATWEPNTADFLSPALEEADLMRMVLKPAEFKTWLDGFISRAGINHLQKLPVVSDRSDLQIVHLDGLCFSRSWCMLGLAKTLPSTDYRKKLFQRGAISHLSAALPNVVSGEYGGEHWLASFAVYALTFE